MKAKRALNTILTVIVITNISYSQIIHTDIVPDTVISNNLIYYLDLNCDTIPDCKLVHEDSVSGLQGNGCGVAMLDSLTEFIGDLPSGDPTHYYPYRLNYGDTIDINANGNQWVVKHPVQGMVRVLNLKFSNGSYAGGSQWMGGVVNGYLGLRVNKNGSWYYGWAKLDVLANATALTLKEYAFNSIPNQGLFAGQLPVSTNIIVKDNADTPTIYSYNNVIYIKDLKLSAQIIVFNSIGQEIFSRKINAGNQSITIVGQTPGIYSITFIFKNSLFSKKVFIE